MAAIKTRPLTGAWFYAALADMLENQPSAHCQNIGSDAFWGIG
jgi:hypothetical protein